MSNKANKSGKATVKNVSSLLKDGKTIIRSESKDGQILDVPLTSVNLEQFAEDAKKIKFPSQGRIGSRSSYIYKYEDHGISKEKINDALGKNFRGKRRTEIKSFCIRMRDAVTENNLPKVKEIIAEFEKHYITYYSVNDFSLSSITQSNNQDDRNMIANFLKVVTSVK